MTTDPASLALADLDALVSCATREASMRERVYPRFIAQNRMTAARADHEITQMQAIVGVLRHLRDRAAGVQELDLGA
jgi:hypothetical protein